MNEVYRLTKKHEELQQAVESFAIASATCGWDDICIAYRHMIEVAELNEYIMWDREKK